MTTAVDLFWDKVAIIPEHACWEWVAAKGHAGHGQLRVAGKLVRAHRFAYELSNGPIPAGLCVCHRCDNPGCVRPEHLFLGTQADNMRDMGQKGRSPSGDRHYSRSRPERSPWGERNGMAKLTAAQAAEIRTAYAAGGATYVALGRRFGVSKMTICDVVNNKRWNRKPQVSKE